MEIQELAREEVVTAKPDTTAADLAATMREANVGSVIIEDDREPVGIVTDRDLALRVVEDNLDASTVYARELMTSELVTVEASKDVLQVTAMMKTHAVRRIPVVDAAGELVGIVTLDDVYHILAREQVNLDEVIRQESPAP